MPVSLVCHSFIQWAPSQWTGSIISTFCMMISIGHTPLPSTYSRYALRIYEVDPVVIVVGRGSSSVNTRHPWKPLGTGREDPFSNSTHQVSDLI